MFPCLTWITDSLLHNLCRRASCLQNAASSVLCFYCLWQWEVHVQSCTFATLTPVLFYYVFPLHPTHWEGGAGS